MSKYQELLDRATALMHEAEEIRKREQAQAVAEIRQKMTEYGLTIEDLGGRKAKAGKAKGHVKYRGPNGETWSGGRGRKPLWIQEALKAGRSLEDFAV